MPQLQKISRNNTVNRFNEITGFRTITLHQTDIVKFNDKVIQLNSNGWQTPTTRNRMMQVSNQYGLGFRIMTLKGYWFVEYQGQKTPYVDGMTLPR